MSRTAIALAIVGIAGEPYHNFCVIVPEPYH